MAEPVRLDRHTRAMRSMDLQIWIVNNFASDLHGLSSGRRQGSCQWIMRKVASQGKER